MCSIALFGCLLELFEFTCDVSPIHFILLIHHWLSVVCFKSQKAVLHAPILIGKFTQITNYEQLF